MQSGKRCYERVAITYTLQHTKKEKEERNIIFFLYFFLVCFQLKLIEEQRRKHYRSLLDGLD